MGLFNEEEVYLSTWIDTTAPDCVKWKSDNTVRIDHDGNLSPLTGSLLNVGGRSYVLVDDSLFAENFAAPITYVDGCAKAYHRRPAEITDAPPFDQVCDVCGTGASGSPPDIEVTFSGIVDCASPSGGSGLNGTWEIPFITTDIWTYEDGTYYIYLVCSGDEMIIVAGLWASGDAFQGVASDPVDPEESIDNILEIGDCNPSPGYGGAAVMRIANRTCCGGAEDDEWPETIEISVSGTHYVPVNNGLPDDWYSDFETRSRDITVTCDFCRFLPGFGAKYVGTICGDYTLLASYTVNPGGGTVYFISMTIAKVTVQLEGVNDDCRVIVVAEHSSVDGFDVIWGGDYPTGFEDYYSFVCSHYDNCLTDAILPGGRPYTFFVGIGTVADLTGSGIDPCCPSEGAGGDCGEGEHCELYWGGTCTGTI